MSSNEIDGFKKDKEIFKLVIIPVGSIEQHGHHLPVLTDSIISEHLAYQISLKTPALVFPAIQYGISYEHSPFFNISIDNSILSRLLTEVCASLIDNNFPNIIILNGHHGNMGVMDYIAQNVEKIKKNGCVYGINYWQVMDNKFDHAGFVETSLMLAIRPDLVNMNLAQSEEPRKFSHIAYSTFLKKPSSFEKITKSGVLGDPFKATEREGRKVLDIIVNNIVKLINELKELSGS